jgi:hypothetical protein
MDEDLREQLVSTITNIIVSHKLPDLGSKCSTCYKELYGEGNGSTLSRHRAEKIVDAMDLVHVFTVFEKAQ